MVYLVADCMHCDLDFFANCLKLEFAIPGREFPEITRELQTLLGIDGCIGVSKVNLSLTNLILTATAGYNAMYLLWLECYSIYVPMYVD